MKIQFSLMRVGLAFLALIGVPTVLSGFDSSSSGQPIRPDYGTGNATVQDTAGNYVGVYAATIVKFTPDGQQAWTRRLYDLSGPLLRQGIAVDKSGSVYVGGSTFNPPHFDDFAIWKFDSGGQLLWRVTYAPPGDTLDDYTIGLGLDEQGNIYLVGRSLDYDIQGASITVLKYDRNGSLLWVRQFDGATNSLPHNTGAMAVNPQGGVAAVTSGAIVSYSAEGDLLWSWVGIASEMGEFDARSDLFVVSLERTELTTRSGLMKFSPTGQLLWRSVYESPSGVGGGIEPLSLKLDSMGNAYLAAYSPIYCTSHRDEALQCHSVPLIVKYSAEGEELWASRFSVPTNSVVYVAALALDSRDQPCLIARLYPLDPRGDIIRDALQGFVAKCDIDGNQIWRRTYTASDPLLAVFGLWWLDAFGGLLASADLEPQMPHVVMAPRAQHTTAGATVTFSARATGAGHSTYQWRFNSEPLPGATEQTLRLSKVQPAQAGDYSVEIRNKFGTVVTPEARLTVVPPF
jgi:hypothetical protein